MVRRAVYIGIAIILAAAIVVTLWLRWQGDTLNALVA